MINGKSRFLITSGRAFGGKVSLILLDYKRKSHKIHNYKWIIEPFLSLQLNCVAFSSLADHRSSLFRFTFKVSLKFTNLSSTINWRWKTRETSEAWVDGCESSYLLDSKWTNIDFKLSFLIASQFPCAPLNQFHRVVEMKMKRTKNIDRNDDKLFYRFSCSLFTTHLKGKWNFNKNDINKLTTTNLWWIEKAAQVVSFQRVSFQITTEIDSQVAARPSTWHPFSIPFSSTSSICCLETFFLDIMIADTQKMSRTSGRWRREKEMHLLIYPQKYHFEYTQRNSKQQCEKLVVW